MSWRNFEQRFPVIAHALKRAAAHGRLAHAYLVHADDPVVRAETPLALAQLRTCLEPASDMTPCGVCRHCHGVVTGAYPVMFKLMPTSKSRQIKIGDDADDPDTMRWFEAQFYYTTSDGAKIGIIEDADCLNEQAQNAFLKTLEEPPADTFFMLVTGFPSKLLPTIRSRCQLLSLLTNQCVYAQPFMAQLAPALGAIQTVALKNLSEAERAASAVIAIAKGLREEAEARTVPQWEPLMDQMKQSEWASSDKKLIEQRRDSAVQAAYLSDRQAFLGAIYDWFALTWQRASGIPVRQLANPEIHNAIPLEMTDEGLARRQLDCAEALLSNLRFNVNEELCLRAFCLDAAFA